MNAREIKSIINNDFDFSKAFHNQDEYKDYLMTKIDLDWNLADKISVYEIAFIKHFELIEYSNLLSEKKLETTYCKKLQSITNRNRLKGISNAEATITRIYKANQYQEELQRNLIGMLKQNHILINTASEYIKSADGRYCMYEHKILNDIGDDLKNKLLRPSAITNILEIYDISHYLNFDFWIPFLKSKYQDIKFIDHKHNARDSKLGKLNNIKQVIIPSTDDIPKYVQFDSLPSSEDIIYRPLRTEITNLLIHRGTKEKNAKEIAGTIVNTYKKYLKF